MPALNHGRLKGPLAAFSSLRQSSHTEALPVFPLLKRDGAILADIDSVPLKGSIRLNSIAVSRMDNAPSPPTIQICLLADPFSLFKPTIKTLYYKPTVSSMRKKPEKRRPQAVHWRFSGPASWQAQNRFPMSLQSPKRAGMQSVL